MKEVAEKEYHPVNFADLDKKWMRMFRRDVSVQWIFL